MLVRKKYNDYFIYYSKEINLFFEIGKRILENNYKIVQIIKDTKRNYVSVIEIDNQKYILKEIRSEIVIPQRRIQTLFKDGEALTCLKNCIEVKNQGLETIAMPLLAIVKKGLLIKKSYLVLEYIDGDRIRSVNDIDIIIELTKKIHNLGRYHGDLNTSNFIKGKNKKIYILDTQLKKDIFSNFKRSYDYLTLKEDLLVEELNYNIEEKYKIKKYTIGYLLASLIKRIKQTKIIKKIRKAKKDLRKKGWKI